MSKFRTKKYIFVKRVNSLIVVQKSREMRMKKQRNERRSYFFDAEKTNLDVATKNIFRLHAALIGGSLPKVIKLNQGIKAGSIEISLPAMI